MAAPGQSGDPRATAGSGRPLRATPVAGEAELLERFRPVAAGIASGYRWPGATFDDALQEALIGVLSGIRTWRPDGGASLLTHVHRAARRQVWTAIKMSLRQKHVPLDHSLRVGVTDEGDHVDAVDLYVDDRTDPARVVAGRLLLREALDAIAEMTLMEQRAVVGIAAGATYAELETDKLGTKSIDNALQRGRQKLAPLKEAA